MAFRLGDRVSQQTYGVGEIISINSDYVTIGFDEGGTRKFVTSKVVLEASASPRVPRAAATRARRTKATPTGTKAAAATPKTPTAKTTRAAG